MRFLNKIITFLKETRVELKKVNWPTRRETIKYTLIVLGVSLGVAVFRWVAGPGADSRPGGGSAHKWG